MLENERLDSVTIATPPQVIPQIALDCAAKGVNVLMEKPCATALSDLNPLFEYQDSVRIMPGFVELFNPVMDDIKTNLKGLGEILTIDSSRIGLFAKRNWGLGVMLDLGLHDVYLHRELAKLAYGDEGASVLQVTSALKYLDPEEEKYEDAIFVLMKFHKIISCINANWVTPSKIRRLKITGTDAALEADLLSGAIKKITGEDLRGTNARAVETSIIPFNREEPLKRELDCFLNQDQEPPINLQDAYEVLKISLQALNQI